MPASSTAASSASVAPTTPAPWGRDLLLLALLFGTLYFFLLGASPLANPDEGRYAEIPREMLARGDWVTPRLNGVFYFEKPPLVYWCTALALQVLGPSEWAARSAPALFALAGVLLTYAAGRCWRDRRTGLFAAAVLGTSLMYSVLARILILDLPLSVLMSATLFCFLFGVRTPPGPRRRAWFYGLYAAAALATLAKGLVGFLVSGAVMFTWLLVFHQWHRLRPFYLPTGAALFLAIAAPWHLLAAQRNAVWAEFYFVREHWLRFTTTMHDRTAPWWYFVPILLAGFFPWTGYLWSAVRHALCSATTTADTPPVTTAAPAPATAHASGVAPGTTAAPAAGLVAWWARQRAARTADAWFLLTWAGFIFLFFSRSQSKLPPYILPIFPALALLVGTWLAHAADHHDARRLRPGLWLWALGLGGLALAALALAIHPALLADAELARAARPYTLTLAAVAAVGVAAWPWLRARRAPVAYLIGAQAASLGAVFLVLAAATPVVIHRDTKALATIVAARFQPGDRIYHYRGFFHDFVFYTGQFVGTVAHQDELELEIDAAARASGRFIDEAEFRRQWELPQRLWVVARHSEAEKLFADPTFHAHRVGATRKHVLLTNRPD